MKRIYTLLLILLGAAYTNFMYSIHPRAQVIIKSLDNQLSQLNINYNASTIPGIQNTIRLLKSYESNEAQKFEEKLKAIIEQNTQGQRQRFSETRTQSPESEPSLTTAPRDVSRQQTPPQRQIESSTERINAPQSPSRSRLLLPATPPPPTDIPMPPSRTISKPTRSEPPTDMPPVLPMPRLETKSSEPQPAPLPPVARNIPAPPVDVPQPPSKPRATSAPSAPPTDTPPALPSTFSQRPLPTTPQDNALKKQLTFLQKQALTQLETYIPTIKGKTLEDAQPIASQFLKELMLGFSRNNARIKSNTKYIASGIIKKDTTHSLPNINGLIAALPSLQSAINIYAIIYGPKKAEPLVDYFTNIKQDFITVMFDNAIECIQHIKGIFNDVGSLTAALTHEGIHGTQGHFIQIGDMLMQLEQLSISYIYDYVYQESDPVANAAILVSESKNIFDILKNTLHTIKNSFDLEDVHEGSLNLKIMQKHSYEMMALMIQQYMYSMPIAPTQKEQNDLNQMIQNNLTNMTTAILQLRLTIKK